MAASIGNVSVVSGAGTSLVFTVTGTNTLSYAQKYAAVVDAASAGGSLSVISLDTVSGGAVARSLAAGTVTEYTVGQTGESVTIPMMAAYTLDSIGGGVTINGAGADTVLVAAINAEATYNAAGSGNQVTFVTGHNTFNGSSVGGGTAGDTVVAGAGLDTINTGVGSTTVNSGSGLSTIYLNDTTTPATGAFNDHVWLDDGKSLVFANGQADAIIATTAGQTVFGGTSTTGTTIVALQPNGDGTLNGNDVIQAGAGLTAVYDSSSNNSVFGGTGQLWFYGGANITASVVGGTAPDYIFGNSGDSIATASNSTDTSSTLFVAGTGNETLFGGNASNNQYLYGYQVTDTTVPASSINDSLVGGSGNDLLVSGSGSDTLIGGAGQNTFLITDQASVGSGANLLLADFGSNAGNLVEFSGYQPNDITSAIANGQDTTTSDGQSAFVITLSDNTTVTFVGITSASELNGHLI